MGTGAQIAAAAAIGGIMGGTRGFRAGRAVTDRWEPVLVADAMLLAEVRTVGDLDITHRTRRSFLRQRPRGCVTNVLAEYI